MTLTFCTKFNKICHKCVFYLPFHSRRLDEALGLLAALRVVGEAVGRLCHRFIRNAARG